MKIFVIVILSMSIFLSVILSLLLGSYCKELKKLPSRSVEDRSTDIMFFIYFAISLFLCISQIVSTIFMFLL